MTTMPEPHEFDKGSDDEVQTQIVNLNTWSKNWLFLPLRTGEVALVRRQGLNLSMTDEEIQQLNAFKDWFAKQNVFLMWQKSTGWVIVPPDIIAESDGTEQSVQEILSARWERGIL